MRIIKVWTLNTNLSIRLRFGKISRVLKPRPTKQIQNETLSNHFNREI